MGAIKRQKKDLRGAESVAEWSHNQPHNKMNTATLTHCTTTAEGDTGLFDSAETAARFSTQGETVEKLETPVTRDDCRPVAGGGFGVW